MRGDNASSDGMQQKFYDKTTDTWYKEDYLGTEGLSEYATSLLLRNSGITHVEYKPCLFPMGKKEVVGCKSKNFLKDGEVLISTYALFKKYRDIDIAEYLGGRPCEEKIKYFVENIIDITGIKDFGQYLTGILQLDAVTKNDDRHFRNICVITEDGKTFRPAPIFDNGGAFLSDQYSYGTDLKGNELYLTVDSVQAKPFSLDFDEQMKICERLYPNNIYFRPLKEKDFFCVNSIYSENDINKILDIMRISLRKYSYLFYDFEHVENNIFDILNMLSSKGHTIQNNFTDNGIIIIIDGKMKFEYPCTKSGLNEILKNLDMIIQNDKENDNFRGQIVYDMEKE